MMKKSSNLPIIRSFLGPAILGSLFSIGIVLMGIFLSGIIFTACASSSRVYYQPGIYTGTGQGYRGKIKVQVHLSEGGIEDIEVLEHQEDNFAAAAMEELLELVLSEGTTDLDAISGATYSSRGFLDAVEHALEKARGKEQ